VEEPRLIEGKLATDDRGEVAFVNGFSFEGVRRFYSVSNFRNGYVRAWHAHKREAKYVTVIRGAALVGCVKIDDWEHPSSGLPVRRFVLTERSPAVLYIPMGYANGFMTLTDGAKLLFFSTATLEESASDDYRFDARTWDCWSVPER
jgi:dTDP-4-dehydrorhamnose 3,5-epimerase-like enzyme